MFGFNFMAKLGNERIEYIESCSLDILEGVYNGQENITSPIDLNLVTNRENLKLYLAEFQDSSISGVLRREQKSIYIKKTDSAKRQFFTIAHELGHWFLHPDLPGDVTRLNTMDLHEDEKKKEIEREANWFASAILMPRPLVLKLWGIFKDVDTIARVFGVSQSAAANRIKNLGLKIYR